MVGTWKQASVHLPHDLLAQVSCLYKLLTKESFTTPQNNVVETCDSPV